MLGGFRPAPMSTTTWLGLKARQAEAYRLAMHHAIMVISGGAGTGKTYLLARLARAFQEAGLHDRIVLAHGQSGQADRGVPAAQG